MPMHERVYFSTKVAISTKNFVDLFCPSLLYKENDEWKKAYAPGGFPVAKDGWNEVHFEPVKTKKLRLEVKLKDGVSAGVQEWEVR